MKYRYLGKSGLLVSRLCLGVMNYGMKDWGCDQDEADAISRRFIEAGGNFFDTADMYSTGVSEQMLAKSLADYDRDDLVLATKSWFSMRPTPNAKGSSRKHLHEAVDASLRRLNTDYIDLYQLHGPDPFTPIEETMRTLDDMVRAGKVRYIGCSNFYAWQIVKANAVADQLHLTRMCSAQHLYNVVRRDIELEILPACDDQGMGMLCWSPLGSGFLTGKYKRGEPPPPGSRIDHRSAIDVPRYFSDKGFDIVDEVLALAGELGKTPAQIALAWLLHNHRVTAPIVGPRTVKQLDDNLAVSDWDLDDEQYQRLSDVVPFNHGYPLEWMNLTIGQIAGKEDFEPRHYVRGASGA